jgi:hypothetical protein
MNFRTEIAKVFGYSVNNPKCGKDDLDSGPHCKK